VSAYTPNNERYFRFNNRKINDAGRFLSALVNRLSHNALAGEGAANVLKKASRKKRRGTYQTLALMNQTDQ
jgi:hypothetical protein